MTVSGPVAGFGSVFVNGVELETPDAVLVTVDGRPADLGSLDVGMRVRVEASQGVDSPTGRAERIDAFHEIRGPVTAPVEGTLPGGTIEVLGQTVRLNDTTVFANLDGGPGTLQPGSFVEVSGLRDVDGSFRATRVCLAAENFADLPDAERELHLTGVVTDVTGNTFRLGGLTVEYTEEALGPGVAAAGGLSQGLAVEVRSAGPLTASGSLSASRVETEARGLEPGTAARLWGVVTAFTSPTDFEVQGHAGAGGADTRYLRGADVPANWAVGRLVEVEGHVDAEGVLVAREVSFELARSVKLQGEVEAGTEGGVTVLGVTVIVNRSTLLRDKRAGIPAFGPALLSPGDRVDVRAFLDGNVPVAARLEREEPREDGRVVLQGPVEIDGTVIVVLGARVDTAAFPGLEVRDADGSLFPTFEDFLAAAAEPGRLVKLRGTRIGAEIEWESAELEVEHRFANEPGVNELRFDLGDD
ncbi:MAG: DUF5666 domain-containing protein [Deferrisomatales bacterium]|nr:DUF5666 domain-containing protein [Deferrisomatales bacterium]